MVGPVVSPSRSATSDGAHRAPVALAFGVLALLVVAWLPPLALPPAAGAVLLGAGARQRALMTGVGAHRTAATAMALGSVAIAVAVALTIVGLAGA